jgi:uncharacterized GH25 family protein
MRLLALAFIFAYSASAAEPVTITGKVVDVAGQPVPHATVMVHSAGAKIGYSSYCPTCYKDCGKRTVTDSEGTFMIGGLSPDLWFTLLAVKDGYSAAYVEKADPAKGPAEPAKLKPRPAIEDMSQIVRGMVVDTHGTPLKDAVVEQSGVKFKDARGVGTQFGAFNWIDQAVVTNDKGEFEIAYSKPAVAMILNVEARGMAPKLFMEPTGADRKTMTVSDGALVRGRLMYNGKPVGNAEVGLITQNRRSGQTYPEIRIGTRDDGTFAITNVPAGRLWLLYPKMESLASRGIGADVVPLETKDDGQEVDLGDIQLKPAYTLRGKIVLTDGKPVPPDMHLTLSADRAWDSQIVPIASDGSFEVRALPSGVYGITPGVKGYTPADGFEVEALVNKNVSDYVIRMQPQSKP